MYLHAGKHVFTPESIKGYLRMDDATATTLFLNSHSSCARNMISRIRSRRLFKRAVYVGRTQVNMDRVTKLRCDERERIRQEIAEKAQVNEDSVILDIPSYRHDMHMQVKVKNLHDFIPFDEIVPLLTLMNQTRREQWRLGVYTPEEHREAVASAAIDILGIQKPTKQFKLSEITTDGS